LADGARARVMASPAVRRSRSCRQLRWHGAV